VVVRVWRNGGRKVTGRKGEACRDAQQGRLVVTLRVGSYSHTERHQRTLLREHSEGYRIGDKKWHKFSTCEVKLFDCLQIV
jgi:hypothetical protein